MFSLIFETPVLLGLGLYFLLVLTFLLIVHGKLGTFIDWCKRGGRL